MAPHTAGQQWLCRAPLEAAGRGDLALYEGLACAREKGKRVLENLEEARQGARQAKAAKRYTEA